MFYLDFSDNEDNGEKKNRLTTPYEIIHDYSEYSTIQV